MKYIWLIFILVLMSSVSAFNSTYTIFDDKVIVDMHLEGKLNFVVPKDIRTIETDGNYTITEHIGFNRIWIENETTLQYISNDFLDNNYFLLDFKSLGFEKYDVKVVLPEKAVLAKDKAMYPEKGQLSTDGRSIMVTWDQNTLNSGDSLIVVYEKDSLLIWPYIILIVCGIVGFLFYNKKKNKKEITKNLFKEEEEIVKILMKKGEMWQKELLKESGLTKVKLSRKLRNLEAKGVVDKIPYGNTNKIRLK